MNTNLEVEGVKNEPKNITLTNAIAGISSIPYELTKLISKIKGEPIPDRSNALEPVPMSLLNILDNSPGIIDKEVNKIYGLILEIQKLLF